MTIRPRPSTTSFRHAAILVVTGLAYLLVARAGLLLASDEHGIAVVWPAAGIGALAVTLSAPVAALRRPMAATVLIAAFAANLWAGIDPWPALAFAAANLGEALLAAVLLLAVASAPTALRGVRGAVAAVASALLAPLAAGVAGAAVATDTFGASFAETWVHWWIADALGILAVAAVVIAWNERGAGRAGIPAPAQAALVAALAAVAGAVFFASATHPPAVLAHTYPVILLAMALAMTGGLPATVTGALAVMITSVAGTVLGRGPFGTADAVDREIVELQTFLGTLLVVTMFIALAADARRRVETDLLGERDRTRALVESLNDAMFVVSTEGVMIDVNAQATVLTGYTRDELVGSRAPFPYADPDLPPERLEFFERLLKDGGSGEIDHSLRHRDGTTVEVVMSAAPLHGPDGTIVGGVRLMRDVRAERAAERAREASEARFRAFVEFAPDGVVIVDGGGRIAVVNARVEQMFGHPRENLIGRPVEMLIPASARTRHTGHRTAYTAAPRTRSMGAGHDLMGLRADGTRFPVDVSLSPLATDDGEMVAAAVRDVTERRRAEAALRAGEERYRSLIAAIADGVVVWAASGRMTECNPAAERILGLERDRLLETRLDGNWRTLREDGTHYPPGDYPAARTLATGEPIRSELMGVRRPDGRVTWISISTQAMDADGETMVVSSFTDVTERLQSERHQAALRRLATLVAEGADARRTFDAIAQETAALCGADACAVLRRAGGAGARNGRSLDGVPAAHLRRCGRCGRRGRTGRHRCSRGTGRAGLRRTGHDPADRRRHRRRRPGRGDRRPRAGRR